MRSSTLLWALVVVFVGAILWLAVTGRLEAGANLVVDMFLNFFGNIARTLRR